VSSFIGIMLLFAGTFAVAIAAPDAIGIASAKGSFSLDRVPVLGNATLFEGGLLETDAYPSTIRLGGGGEAQLGSGSRGRVYRDRLLLEKGEARMDGASNFRFEALGLQVLADSKNARASVSLRDPRRVAVSTASGSMRVMTSQGILLARLDQGQALDFEPQVAGAAAPIDVRGCVSEQEGRLLLLDSTTRVSFEIRGQNLERYKDKNVQAIATIISGAKPSSGASQVAQVTRINQLAGSCPARSATATSDEASKGGPGDKTVSRTKVVIAGVAIAASIGGTTIGLTADEPEPISR
jgi:hypothetical protein